MNTQSLTALYNRMPALPSPTLDPYARKGEVLRAIPHTNVRGWTTQRGGLSAYVKAGDGLTKGWGGEHIVMAPPTDNALGWLRKGLDEAKSMIVGLPTEALTAELSFWKANPPRCMAFCYGGGVWVFWSLDGMLPAPKGMTTVLWV